MKKVLVCGDRYWDDYRLILSTLRIVNPDVVIEGEASGADSLGARAAEAMGIPVERFPADWKGYGRAAGPIRNKKMLEEGKPDLVLAFHDDLSQSRGTAHMVQIARRANIPVYVISHNQTTTKELVK